MAENDQQQQRTGIIRGSMSIADIGLLAILRHNETEANKDRDDTKAEIRNQTMVLARLLAAASGRELTPEEIKKLVGQTETEVRGRVVDGFPIQTQSRTRQFWEGFNAPWTHIKKTFQLGEFSPDDRRKKQESIFEKIGTSETDKVLPKEFQEDQVETPTPESEIPRPSMFGAGGHESFVQNVMDKQTTLLSDILTELRGLRDNRPQNTVTGEKVQPTTGTEGLPPQTEDPVVSELTGLTIRTKRKPNYPFESSGKKETSFAEQMMTKMGNQEKVLKAIQISASNIEAILQEQKDKRILGEGSTTGTEEQILTGNESSDSGSLLSSVLGGMGLAGIGSKILDIFKGSKLTAMIGGIAAMLKDGVTAILKKIGESLSRVISKVRGGVGGAGKATIAAAKGAKGIAGKVLGGLGRIAPVVGAAVGAIGTLSEVSDINEQVEAGDIDAETADQLKRESIGEGFGTAAGSALGGVVGSIAGPIGSIAGATVGGWAGGKLGSVIGKRTGEIAREADAIKQKEMRLRVESPEVFEMYENRKHELIKQYTADATDKVTESILTKKAINKVHEEFKEVLNNQSRAITGKHTSESVVGVVSSSSIPGSVSSIAEEEILRATPRHTPTTLRTVMDEYRIMSQEENGGKVSQNVVNSQVVNNNVNNSSVMPIKAEPRTQSPFQRHLNRTSSF